VLIATQSIEEDGFMVKRLGVFVLATSLILAGCGTAAKTTSSTPSTSGTATDTSKPKTLVVACYGGSFEKGMKENIIPQFEKKFNAKVTYITGSSTDTLAKLQAQKDKPQIDVAFIDDGPQAQAKAFGLLAPFDKAKLTNLANVYDLAKDPDNIGVGVGVNGTGLCYNEKTFTEKSWAAPTSWNDLAKPEFKGKLVLPSFANTYGVHMLVMLAKANGGSETNIEPGFAKLKDVAKNAVTFDKTADVSNYFMQGETVASAWGLSRVNTLKDKNFPIGFVYPKEGTVALLPIVSLVKNAPNPDLAQEFVNFVLAEDAQKTLAKDVFMGPVNKNVKLDQDVAAKVIYGETNINKLLKVDWKTINEKRAEWTERINKEIEIAH
jgi:putative spermidine/putrescine transport system substrate-binding protein